MERLLGLIFLLILCILSWLNLRYLPRIIFSIPEWLLPVLVVTAILLPFVIFTSRYLWSLLNKVQRWIRLLIETILQIPMLMVRKPVGSTKVLLGTIFFQLLSLLIVYESLIATRVSISLWQFMAVAPIVTVVLMLPISVQGVGVRESLYLSLLVPFGANPEGILAGLALTYLIGIPYILWGWLLYYYQAKLAAQNI